MTLIVRKSTTATLTFFATFKADGRLADEVPQMPGTQLLFTIYAENYDRVILLAEHQARQRNITHLHRTDTASSWTVRQA